MIDDPLAIAVPPPAPLMDQPPPLRLETIKTWLQDKATFSRAVYTLPQFSGIVCDGDTLTAMCAGTVVVGSGKQKKNPSYKVTVMLAAKTDKTDLFVFRSKCTCPDRKKTCKHVGGLLLSYIKYIPSDDIDVMSEDDTPPTQRRIALRLRMHIQVSSV